MLDSIREAASRLAENRCDGSSVERGMLYHDLPFPELSGMAAHRRGNRHRFRLMASRYDFKGKSGVDLGCSVGGLSFRLALAGAKMVGVDYDPAAIGVADAVREWRLSIGDSVVAENTSFICGDVAEFPVPECDFCIWLSVFMWVWKLHGRDAALAKLAEVSQRCDVLFFDTASGKGDGMAGDVVDMTPEQILARSGYANVVRLGVPRGRWFRRPLFMCWGRE